MVSVKVPRVLPVTTVRVAVEPGLTGFGVKLARASPGRPLTLRLTGLAKPAVGLIVTVKLAVPLRPTLCDPGVAVRPKSAGAGVGVGVGVGDAAGVGVGVGDGALVPVLRTTPSS